MRVTTLVRVIGVVEYTLNLLKITLKRKVQVELNTQSTFVEYYAPLHTPTIRTSSLYHLLLIILTPLHTILTSEISPTDIQIFLIMMMSME